MDLGHARAAVDLRVPDAAHAGRRAGARVQRNEPGLPVFGVVERRDIDPGKLGGLLQEIVARAAALLQQFEQPRQYRLGLADADKVEKGGHRLRVQEKRRPTG